MPTLDDLLTHIFDGQRPALCAEFEGWVRESRRYKAFATTYRSKIRTKLKQAHDEAMVMDVRAELEAAALLLREERFTLEYERYAAAKQRGPDFTVTFRTHTPFNIEVRRVRALELDDGEDARITKLLAVLCDKVGQMPPSIVNLLWLAAERELAETDVSRAARTLLQLAERKDEPFFTRRGFESAAGFLKAYQRLSGIIVWQPGETVLWQNALARHKPPTDIMTALGRLLRGGR